ncbi:DUF397 domain-containing protein [Streptomyces sp. NPDC001889]
MTTSTTTPGPPDRTHLIWRASSYSAGAGNCVEVATGQPERIPVRDSKRPSGPHLLVGRAAFTDFLRFVESHSPQQHS